MKKFSSFLLLSLFAVLMTTFVSYAADPIITIKPISSTTICSTGNDTLFYSVAASNIPANTNVVIYQSLDSTFNPTLGQGDSIGFIPGSSIPQDTVNFGSCIKTLGILIDACGASGLEGRNEYIILTSGSGIKVSNLAIDFSSQNNNGPTNVDINTGNNPCNFKTPTPSLITALRVGSCNASNVISASPTDTIPANAIILCFTSDNVTANYSINGLCNLGYPIYVVQSACTRTIGAFTNDQPSNCLTNSGRFRTTKVTDKRQNCKDNFTYDLCGIFNEDGTFAIRQPGTDTSSVANNGIRINAKDTCGGIDYTQLDFSADTILKFAIPTSFCNTGFNFIKAVLKPNTQPATISNTISYKLVCNDVKATTNTTNICSGKNAIIDISSSNPNATFSWTISGGTNITGASAGTGNQINQTLVYTGATNGNLSYIISSNDAGCTKRTVIDVVVKNCDTCDVKPTITGNTTICNGLSTTLTVQGEFDSVRWNTGATSSSISVSSAATYSVTAYLGACSGSARVNVITNSIPVTITGDKIICGGNTVVLTANGTFDSLRWNTGATSTSINVKNADTYSVTAFVNGCSGTATFDVVRVSLEYSLDKKIENICSGDTAKFVLFEGDLSASAVDSFYFTQPGKFQVSYQTSNCGIFIDTVEVIINEIPKPFSLGNDTTFCGNFTKVLSTGNENTIWSTGETGAQISVSETGEYTATISNNCGLVSDTIKISQNEIPRIFIGNDTVFCDEPLILSINSEQEFRSIFWNTGEETTTINVETAGTYSVRVTSLDGCSANDTIILGSNCSNDIWLPNAFSPNGDNINDVFYVRGNPRNCSIERFVIFNRWGNKVFETNNILPDDITAGWNGTYKGKTEQTEVYGYEVIAKFANGEKRMLKGNVTLIR